MWCAGQFQGIGQGYLAYDLTRSAGLLGVISVGYGLPMIALALFGGAIADRMKRKRLIQLFQGAEALIALGLAISVISGTVTWYHILAASIIHGALFAFMLPARQAIIPELVDKSEITNAIALNSAGQSVVMLTAPAICGTLYAIFGPEAVFIGMFVFQSLAVILTEMVPTSRQAPVQPKQNLFKDVKDGIRVMKNNRVILVLIGMALTSTMFAMPFTHLLPVLVVAVYGKNADALGILSAIIGLGSLVGSLIVASIGNWKRGVLLLTTSFITGITLLSLAIFPYYFAGLVIMLFMGFGASPQRALKESLVMDAVDDVFRGRVMSVLMMTIGLVPIGVLPLGLIVDAFGPTTALAIMGTIMTVMTSIVFFTQKIIRDAQ